MAVENLTATGAGTTSAVGSHGLADTVKYDSTTVEVSASASASSTYALHRVPSGARITAASKLYWDDLATAGSPTLDIGVSGPSFTYNDALLNDGLDAASAGTGSIIIKTIDNYGKPLWELAALTSDPGEVWTVKVKIKDADVTTGGTLRSELFYKLD